MTDKEIIKALECCTPTNESCLNCPLINVSVPECAEILYKESIDLINRQQAEIERLKRILNTDVVVVCGGRGNGKSETIRTIIEARVTEIKAEAIKEFAERLKDNMSSLPKLHYDNYDYYTIGFCFIDNLVKEMVGDE